MNIRDFGKKALKTAAQVAAVGLYAASLGSPVIGAVAGAFMGGFAGAAVGLFAGPIAAAGVMTGIYVAAKTVRFMMKSPEERKESIAAFNPKQALRETGEGMGRAMAWAVSLSVFVGTLGRVNVSFDWGQPSYDDNNNAAPVAPPPSQNSTAPLSLPETPLAERFANAKNAAPATPAAEKTNTAKPQTPPVPRS
ncbi:MAG TPA: hypothetical protein PLX33_12985 [Alphaproteobacteria bacterium]|nr:hypothetical protein [Alphaproteobacteria bacterium]